MHSKGVRFGTYSDEGTKTCGGYPGTKDHEVDDANTFASWGVDYLKLDGCNNNHAGFVTGYPAAGAALQATGRSITYSCSWPPYLGSDESAKPWDAMIEAGCNLWRIGETSNATGHRSPASLIIGEIMVRPCSLGRVQAIGMTWTCCSLALIV